MIPDETADQFATDWIVSWNAHDIDRIMDHYADDVEFTSPFVIKLMDEPSGTVRGKDALREYFQKGLPAYPGLHFELLNVLTGVDSVTLVYRSVNDLLAAEVMQFNNAKVSKVLVHYSR